MRDTYEIPGGHREEGEPIDQTAERELREETGAVDFCIEPVCAYSVTDDSGEINHGMLYYAKISGFGEIDSEIERIELFDKMPVKLTYPGIQPKLMEEVLRRKLVDAAE